MNITEQLDQLVTQSLNKLGLPSSKIQFAHPADEQFGDYSTNIAMQLFATSRKECGYSNPRALAQAIVENLQTTDSIEKTEVAGPGFINFYLSASFLTAELKNSLHIPNIGQNRTVIVEYSSPNIAKPFTIGHLRSTIIGDAVANLLTTVGYEVRRDNHLGDWGTQFGKQIYAIKTWGNEDAIARSENPVKELVTLYVKFHEEDEGRLWFKKLEDGDPEARRLWQRCIEWSWQEFEKIYQKLGIAFTENGGRGYGESYFEDKMDPIITELKEKDLLKEGKDGAQMVFFPGDLYPPLMIVKSDGATLYATRDLATDKFRMENYPNLELIANEVGAEQALYFKQLFEIERLLGWFEPDQRVHIKHGLYRFKDQKMSTRKGNVIWLEEVLQQAIEKAATLASENTDPTLAEQVGIGALKWNDLKRNPHLDVTFDWDELLSLEGNSGPYIQYTYVRGKSVLEKASQVPRELINSTNLEPEELSLLKWIYRYPEVVVEAAHAYSPNTICTYIFELAQRYNSFYNKHSILNAQTEQQVQLRVLITQSVTAILKHGLSLLGIETPSKM